MVEAEIQVCNRLKEECKRLTQQLHDSSEKARYILIILNTTDSFDLLLCELAKLDS